MIAIQFQQQLAFEAVILVGRLLRFVSISAAVLKSLSTGALEAMVLLYTFYARMTVQHANVPITVCQKQQMRSLQLRCYMSASSIKELVFVFTAVSLLLDMGVGKT